MYCRQTGVNMDEQIYEHNIEECEYIECTYEEWDTGYKEFECTLLGVDCLCERCPLCFKYYINE